jgi:hypothetical protein
VASWASGRLDVFARGTDNELYHKWYAVASGWSGWESLGGALTYGPAAVSWGPNRIAVVVGGANDAVSLKAYDGTAGWSEWQSLDGSITASPAAASRASGLLDVFARGTDNALYRKAWTPPPPAAITEVATNITWGTAVLNGTVNPEGAVASAQFEYGLTISYGLTTSPTIVGSQGTPTPISQTISGLQDGKVYHFRVVARNAGGATYGADSTFATPSGIAKSGTEYISLQQEGPGSFDYSDDVTDPNEFAVHLGQATAASIVAITSPKYACSVSVGGSVYVNFNVGQTVSTFHGKPVKEAWAAQFSGKTTELPTSIPLTVTWTRP